MEIILIRHGKPLSAANTKLSSEGFKQWVTDYDISELDPQSHPQQRIDLSHYHVISSDLKRAIDSTIHYCGHQPIASFELYREMDIPFYPSSLTLRAWTWVYWNRLRWILGKPGPFESFLQAKDRAKRAAKELEHLANEHKRVALFAHGMMNRYIRIYLKELGWHVEEKDDKYWGVNRLRLDS